MSEKNRTGRAVEELVIRFKRQTYYADERSYNARIVRSPIPLQGGDFRADIDAELSAFGALFESLVGISSQYYPYDQPPTGADPLLEAGRETLAELGAKLYELLPISFRDGLLRWVQLAYVQGRDARLVLEVQLGDKAERLLALPWELLFSAEAVFQPARSPRFAIERRLIGAPLRSPTAIDQPTGLLHLVATPGEGEPIDPELIQLEKEILPDAVGPDNYQLVAQPGSVARLIAAQRQHPAQILHFLGHGLPVAADGEGAPIRSYLQFAGEEGETQRVTGEHLQQLLQDGPALQMVVLTACYTGTATSGNIAYDLVASGFPYVVAMQSAMPQPALGHFIRRFYEEIQKGQPPDRAVAAGRHAIAAHFPGSLSWCLPVLYSGAGLPPRSRTAGWIDGINRWLTPAVFQQVWLVSGGMGAAHLLVALLLWLSGVSLPPLDALFLLKATGWLIPASLAISLWYTWKGEMPQAADLPSPHRGTLFLHIWGAVAIGVGLATFFVGYFTVALLAGLGFWSLLSPLSQLIILIPVQLLALLLGLAQAHNHGLGFLNSNRVKSIPFELSDSLFVLVGSLFVLAPGLLAFFAPDLLAPPLLNLLIGALNAVLAVIFFRERQQKR
ncbi:MAG: CHAT domain-containing protein [Chloroflexi bacterium]|nr:CHAT domain-containing protein [Chloroflexota bacterium]